MTFKEFEEKIARHCVDKDADYTATPHRANEQQVCLKRLCLFLKMSIPARKIMIIQTVALVSVFRVHVNWT